MQKIQGWVEQGDTKVSISGLLSTTLVQRSFPLSTVTVYDSGTTNVSSIFSDNTGTPTPLANPFTANSDGTWGFFAPDGVYDVVFSGFGIANAFTIFSLQAFDGSRQSGTLIVSRFPGATLGVKLNNAHAALPSTGGVLDARGSDGAQIISVPVNITKPNVTILFGAATISVSALTTISGNNATVIGNGTTFTFPNGQAIGIQMFRLTGTFVTLTNCIFDGNKAGVATQPDVTGTWNSGAPRIYYTPIDMEGATEAHIFNNRFFNVSTSSVNLNNCGRVFIESNSFTDCYMDPIFTNLGSGQTSEYIRVNGNIIKNIHYGNTVGMAYGNGMIVDAFDIEVTNNIIDTTDRSACKPTEGGPNRILVANNICRNIGLAIGYPAFALQGANGATTDAIYVNNVINDIGGGGIAINGTDPGGHLGRIKVSGNNIYNTGAFAATSNPQGIQVIFGDTVLIEDNLVDTCPAEGIRIYDCTDVKISGNHVQNITTTAGDGIDIAGAAGSTRVTITDNVIHTTVRYGINVEDPSTDILIARNTIRNPGTNGIQVGATAGTVDLIENEVYFPHSNGIVSLVTARVIGNKVFNPVAYGYALTNPSWLNNVTVAPGVGPLSVAGSITLLDGTYFDVPNLRLAIGPQFTTPANATLHVLDATPATGVTRVLIQSADGQTGNLLLDLIDQFGNDGLAYYPLATPSLILNRSDAGEITIQLRANQTVKNIIGYANTNNAIAGQSIAGDFVIRTQDPNNGVCISSTGAFGGRLLSGQGSPEGVISSSPGSLYFNVSGGAGTSLYVKESGNGATGWIGK